MNIRQIADLLSKGMARDIERGLQLASGATFLALLTAISGVWGRLPEGASMMLVFVQALLNFGGAFGFAMLSTWVGLEAACRPQAGSLEKKIIGYLWASCIGLSVALLVFGGWELVNDLLDVLNNELDMESGRLDRLEERLRELEQIPSDGLNGGVVPHDG